MVIILIARLSIQILQELSFLGVRIARTAQGLTLSLISPFSRSLSTCICNSACSLGP